MNYINLGEKLQKSRKKKFHETDFYVPFFFFLQQASQNSSYSFSRPLMKPALLQNEFLGSLNVIVSKISARTPALWTHPSGVSRRVVLTVSLVSVTGLGFCFSFLPTVTILSQYFDRRRSVVTAVASTGECFAMFAFAPGKRTTRACVFVWAGPLWCSRWCRRTG